MQEQKVLTVKELVQDLTYELRACNRINTENLTEMTQGEIKGRVSVLEYVLKELEKIPQ